MTYNLCCFLGNKAFVIDFLETGITLLCVFLRPTGKELSGEIIFPPLEFRRAFSFKFIWCVAVICQQNYSFLYLKVLVKPKLVLHVSMGHQNISSKLGGG